MSKSTISTFRPVALIPNPEPLGSASKIISGSMARYVRVVSRARELQTCKRGFYCVNPSIKAAGFCVSGGNDFRAVACAAPRMVLRDVPGSEAGEGLSLMQMDQISSGIFGLGAGLVVGV